MFNLSAKCVKLYAKKRIWIHGRRYYVIASRLALIEWKFYEKETRFNSNENEMFLNDRFRNLNAKKRI